jgi:anaerobic magnesium-protoporphyrin IX monomethyl ester cyclase
MTSKLDLLLITPPSKNIAFQDLSRDLVAIEPPVWSTLLATFLRQKSVSVEILDAEAESIGYDETARRITEIDALLTVFVIYGHQPSASTQSMPAGKAVAERIRESSPGLKMLVMGTHASALPERTLIEEPYDFVCEGEGPYTILALVEMLKAGADKLEAIPGLWYQIEGKICSNTRAPDILDLDKEIPGQAWDLLDMGRYRAHNWHCFDHIDQRQPYASIQTGLGCPYKCSFCCINAPFERPANRLWSPKIFIDQIDLVVNKYGVKNIKIPDEMFVLNEKHVMGICDLLIERNYELNIWAYARIDTIKDRYLEKLKQAGFNWLALGIESGSKYVRDGVEKGSFNDRDILQTSNKIKEHGIYIIANYIFGLPDDTHEGMQETLDLAIQINAEWANFYCTMAYPGSPLYSLGKEQGLALPDDDRGPGWIGYSQHGYETLPLPTNTLTSSEVLDFRDSAFNKYFNHPRFQDMIRQKFGSNVIDHIKTMLDVKVKRKHRDQSIVS